MQRDSFRLPLLQQQQRLPEQRALLGISQPHNPWIVYGQHMGIRVFSELLQQFVNNRIIVTFTP
jgi:hypothetical protein